ncbi:MAG: DUF3810 family protein [Lachnospiraceae bacterium]|nr:DUF3810 family protein [Lachnospiraceae bacterium]
MKKLPGYLKTVIILFALILVTGLPALSPRLCDWYTDHIYGILCDAVSHITGLFPFAVGEIIMYLGIVLLMAGIVLLLLLIFLRKKPGYRRVVKKFFQSFSIALLVVVLIYMPTWFVPFCGTVLGQGNPELRTTFTYEEISELLNYVVQEGNAAAEEIAVGEDGSVTFRSTEENRALVIKAMQDLGAEFPRLKGYYPPVKTALCSDVLDRMGIGGYNYPYTMEPTHNRYMSPMWMPVLEAHEYSHHKGYYKENEANLLSVLALSRSGDPYLRLAAFMEMYDYLYQDYICAMDQILDQKIAAGEITDWPEQIQTKEDIVKRARIYSEIFGPEPEFTDRVYRIYAAAAEEEQAIYEEDSHPIDNMPAVNEVITETADTGWKVQGDILQENSYDGVTLLLLQYFYGEE